MKYKILIYICTISFVMFIFLAINILNGNLQFFNDMTYKQIELWINPLLTKSMIIMGYIGKWYIFLLIALLLLVIPKSRAKMGIPLTLAVFVSALLNFILKNMFAIARPNTHRLISESGYGFPSGHAMSATVFIGLCAFLFISITYKKSLKIMVFMFSFVFILLMGFSRIYLGVHTPTDILGGYLAGTVILTFSIFILDNRQLLLNQGYLYPSIRQKIKKDKINNIVNEK